MRLIRDLAGMLCFRLPSLQAAAGRRALAIGMVFLAAGFLSYGMVRNAVYADLITERLSMPGWEWLSGQARLHLVPFLSYAALLYLPVLVCLANALAGDGLGFSVSVSEYLRHASALLPLWGALFLLAAPIQWFWPEFLVVGPFGVSIGLLALSLAWTVHTVWALAGVSRIPILLSVATVVLSLFTLPLFYLLVWLPWWASWLATAACAGAGGMWLRRSARPTAAPNSARREAVLRRRYLRAESLRDAI